MLRTESQVNDPLRKIDLQVEEEQGALPLYFGIFCVYWTDFQSKSLQEGSVMTRAGRKRVPLDSPPPATASLSKRDHDTDGRLK